MKVTLLICTIDRVIELDRLLTSLYAQTYKNFEIIIVDQNPPSKLADLLAGWHDKLPIRRYVVDFKGLSRARNYGIKLAKGSIISFPDDDCIYEPCTLDKVVDAFSHNRDLGTLIANHLDYGEKLKYANPSTVKSYLCIFRARAASFTIFVRARELEKLAPWYFNELIGVGAPTIWGSGEETDLLIRLFDNNTSIEKHSEVVVCHSKADHLSLKTVYYGLGRYYILRKHKLGLFLKLINILQPIIRSRGPLRFTSLANRFLSCYARTGLPRVYMAPHYSPTLNNDVALKKLQYVQLEILLEFKRICDVNSIPYTLLAGSLLGAMRHKGFIPWDDDIDVGLKRQDFNKFVSVARYALDSDRFAIRTIQSERFTALPSAKMCRKGSIAIEQYSLFLKNCQEIAIDIFPLDYSPDNRVLRQIHKVCLGLLQACSQLQAGFSLPRQESSAHIKLVYYLLVCPLSRIIPKRTVRKLLDFVVQSFSNTGGSRIGALTGSYGYSKELFPSSWMDSLHEIEFMGHKFSAMTKSHEYLSNLYGDYLVPPPSAQQRSSHDLIAISFPPDSL